MTALANTRQKFKSYLVSRIPSASYNLFKTPKLFIPYYHMINDEEVLHTKHLYPHKTIKHFENDLDYILKYFAPISLTDLIAHQRDGKKLPARAFHLTFDDGFREMHDIVSPILLRKEIPATFFINSSFTDNKELCFQHKACLIVAHLSQHGISKSTQKQIEDLLMLGDKIEKDLIPAILLIKYARMNVIDEIANVLEIDFRSYLNKIEPYLTQAQVQKLLADGFTIGAHSIDHPLYADLSLEDQIHQTLESVKYVRNTFHLDYGAFAFPHSDLGVSKTYFDEIKKSGLVDLSFGTAGLIEDCVQYSIQRFSLEKPLLPAKNIFAMQAAKRLWRILKHTNKINRQPVRN